MTLLRLLERPSVGVRHTVVNVLCTLSLSALGAHCKRLVALFWHPTPGVREAAVEVLCRVVPATEALLHQHFEVLRPVSQHETVS